jgi:4-alpha-glucanotransferase
MAKMGLPGFKIPMWERLPDGSMKGGETYERISVATYATHDHAPVITQWEEWQAGAVHGGEEEKGCLRILGELLRFSGHTEIDPMTPFGKTVHRALLDGLLACNSWIAIPMVTDLFGTNQRFNVPGAVGSANWTARIAESVSEWNACHQDLLVWWRSAVIKSGRC